MHVINNRATEWDGVLLRDMAYFIPMAIKLTENRSIFTPVQTLTLPSMADADSAIDRMSIDSRCTRNHKQQQRALQPTSDETVRRSREGSVEGDKLLEVPFEVQAADTELQKDLGATSMAR